MMSNSYYRVCKSVKDRGVLVPEGTNLDQFTDGEAYISAFKYNEDHKKQFEKIGSVAGITDVTTDIIYFDLDNKDIEVSRRDTLEVVNRLKNYEINPNDIKICLSGNKGLHLAIHTTSVFTPEQAKSIATKIAGDLESFDSSIYNANRIIRLEGSLHSKTGLRKTGISFEELNNLSMTEIKELAKERYDYYKPPKVSLSQNFISLSELPTKDKKDVVTIEDGVDYLSNPFRFPPRVLAISQGFFPEGQRSNALMILATNLKNKGLNKTQCHHYLRAAADQQSNRYECEPFHKKEIWTNIVEQIYKETWRGGQYTEDNYPVQLQRYFEELGVPIKEFSNVAGHTVRIDEKFDDFVQYATDIDKYTMEFGIPSLDKKLRVRKGHLIGLLAGPGIGKTSFGITLLNNCSKRGSNCFFASMDMYSLNVYQKLIQRHTGYSEEEMFQYFKNKDQNKIEEFRKILKENYGNVAFSFKAGMNIEEMKKLIKMEEDKSGKTLDLILVDYLELIQTDKTDPTASSAEAINGLREIANEGRVVVVLLQPNKISSKPDQALLSYNSAKGSSMIAQAVTAMITAHRPGYSSENPENDKYFSINVVKNRNGALFQLDFAWEGRTQTISELTAEQKFELSVLRDTKEDADELGF